VRAIQVTDFARGLNCRHPSRLACRSSAFHANERGVYP
jgi:hypothetical protein